MIAFHCAANRALQAKRAQCTFGTLSLATIRNNQKKQPARHKAFWGKRACAIGVSVVIYFETETNSGRGAPFERPATKRLALQNGHVDDFNKAADATTTELPTNNRRDDDETADKPQPARRLSGGILRPHLRQNVTDLRIRLRNFVT